jgi:hypothetical protein
MMDPHTILQQAQDLISGDRNQDYNHPLDNFTRIAELWSIILDHPVTAEDHVLCMMAVKISRLLHTPEHMDSVVDLAGYAGTYEMVLKERKRRSALYNSPTA